MTERKRGLGRGLGALIPDVVTDDRPVDVFFPGKKEKGDVSRETMKDPSESMRQSRSKARSGDTRRTAAKKTAAAASKPNESASNKTKTSSAGTTKSSSAKRTIQASGESASSRSAGEQSKARAGRQTTAAPPQPASAEGQSVSEEDNVSRETELESVPGTAFGMLKIGQIRPNPKQPRTVFDEDDMSELIASIKEVGILQPIVVRVVDSAKPQYELIMGERRFRASEAAGLKEIPAIIREVKDDELLRDALLENLHRSDLNPLEEAAAYQQLLDDFQCTQDELSDRIGRSRPQIANTLRLLKLPPLVQRRVAAGVLSAGHARALLGLHNASDMEVLAQRIVAEGLSVRATEELVVLTNKGQKPRVSRETRHIDPDLADIARAVGDKLDTKVNIMMGKRKGKLTVDFANQEDLQRILKVLGLDGD